MNKQRRNKLAVICDRLQGLLDEIQIVSEGEDMSFESLPESLQGTPRGEAMQTAIGDMEEATNSIEAAIEALERAATGGA